MKLNISQIFSWKMNYRKKNYQVSMWLVLTLALWLVCHGKYQSSDNFNQNHWTQLYSDYCIYFSIRQTNTHCLPKYLWQFSIDISSWAYMPSFMRVQYFLFFFLHLCLFPLLRFVKWFGILVSTKTRERRDGKRKTHCQNQVLGEINNIWQLL